MLERSAAVSGIALKLHAEKKPNFDREVALVQPHRASDQQPSVSTREQNPLRLRDLLSFEDPSKLTEIKRQSKAFRALPMRRYALNLANAQDSLYRRVRRS